MTDEKLHIISKVSDNELVKISPREASVIALLAHARVAGVKDNQLQILVSQLSGVSRQAGDLLLKGTPTANDVASTLAMTYLIG